MLESKMQPIVLRSNRVTCTLYHGDCMDVLPMLSGVVSGEGGGILQGQFVGDPERNEEASNKAANAGQHCRQGTMFDLRDGGGLGDSSQERRPLRQSDRESASALQSMPHERYEEAVVEGKEGRAAYAKKQWPGGLAIVTDPPYGISLRMGSKNGRYKNGSQWRGYRKNGDVDGHRSARTFLIHGDDDQSIGISILEWAAANDLTTIAFASPWKPWPGEWRNLIVWDKGGAVGGGGDIKTCLKRTWELIQVARNGPMTGRREESVWRFPITPRDTVDHICAKPPSLLVALIGRFTMYGQTILDPFMGSGTTGVACIREGRHFIGIERDEKYFQIAVERIRRELQQERLF